MQRRWKKKIQGILEMIPPLRGGDFQGMAGLSSDDSLLVGGATARERNLKKAPALSNIGSMSPARLSLSNGCVPALPASVSPGRRNFSGKAAKAVQGQLRTKRLPSLTQGWKSSYCSPSGRGRNILLDIPLYRTGVNAH
jgi:hypothetical protein